MEKPEPVSASVEAPAGTNGEAQPTKLHAPLQRWIERATEIAMIVCSLTFLVFAAVAFALDHKPVATHQWGQKMLQAAKLGPTIWPIVFGVVIGHMIATLNRWLIERPGGERLHVVEQLHASRSLASTIAMGTKLQRFGIDFFLLAVLWVFSPIGGQASLRVLGVSQVPIYSERQVSYVPGTWDSYILQGGSSLGQFGPAVQGTLVSAILAPESVKNSSMDAIGNLKVPLLQQLEGYTPDDLKKHNWVDVGSPPTYSSLVGSPVFNLGPNGETDTFTMQATYITLDCPVIESLPTNDIFTNLQTQGKNNSCNPLLASAGTDAATSLLISTSYGKGDAGTLSERGRRLDFYWKWPPHLHAGCYAKLNFVDANVTCDGTRCSITKMRSADAPKAASASISDTLDLCPYAGSLFSTFADGVARSGSAYSLTLAEAYIYNPGLPLVSPQGTGAPPEISSSVTRKNFEVRLTQLLNSVRVAAIGQIAEYGASATTDLKTQQKMGYKNANVTAQSSVFESQYVCNKGWTGVLVLCSLVLLLGAVAGLCIGIMTVGPDLLGYVSTLTRNNPYCPPKYGHTGSALDGAARTKQHGDARLQLKDVGDGNYGHIALGWADSETAESGANRLDPKKEYI